MATSDSGPEWTILLGVGSGIAAIASGLGLSQLWAHFFGRKKLNAETGLLEAQTEKIVAETPSAEAVALHNVLHTLYTLTKAAEQREIAAAALERMLRQEIASLRADNDRANLKAAAQISNLRADNARLEGKIGELNSVVSDVCRALSGYDENCGACELKPPISPELVTRLRRVHVEDHGGSYSSARSFGGIAET